MTSEVIAPRRAPGEDRGTTSIPESEMSRLPVSFLGRVLLADAVLSGATGLLMLVGAGPLSSLLELPVGLLRGAGLVLLPFVAFVFWLSQKPVPNRAAVWAVVLVNAVWVVDSVGLAFGGMVSPNALGLAFVLGQAAVVAVFAELGFVALRNSSKGGFTPWLS
jgi:hypothetical protein